MCYSWEEFQSRTVSSLSIGGLLDWKLGHEDLNDEGNRFSSAYLPDLYLKDFEWVFMEQTADSHPFDVADSWENFDLLAERIDKRYKDWKAGKDLKRPWWKLWGGNLTNHRTDAGSVGQFCFRKIVSRFKRRRNQALCGLRLRKHGPESFSDRVRDGVSG